MRASDEEGCLGSFRPTLRIVLEYFLLRLTYITAGET